MGILALGHAIGQVPWNYKVTGTNHTILLDENLVIEAPGYSGSGVLGVFYDSIGVDVCAGYVELNRATDYLIAYGESGSNDGLASGDTFKFKLWDSKRKCVYEDVSVEYELSNDTPHSGTFVSDGISNVAMVEARALPVEYPVALICPGDSLISPVSLNNNALQDITFSAEDGLEINSRTGRIDGQASLPGSYTVMIKSQFCISSPTQTIRVSPYRDVTIPDQQLKCPNERINIRSLPGEAADVWSASASVDGDSSLGTGKHNIIFESPDGCTIEKAIQILDYPEPELQFEKEYGCESTTVRLENQDQVSALEWQDYSLEVFRDSTVKLVYTDLNQCKRVTSVNVTVKNLEALSVNTRIEPADCYEKGQIEILSADISNAVGSVRYEIVNVLTGEPLEENMPVPEGKYRIHVFDSRNCSDTWEQGIIVMKDCLNDRPVFSPNNDYVDDDYFISDIGEAEVYDRHGIKVSEFQTPIYWDGTDQQGQRLPMGTYLIVINGEKVIIITILR